MPIAGQYQTYKDSNGVTWTVYDTQKLMNIGLTPETNPTYVPAPDDFSWGKPTLGIDEDNAQEVAERDRAVFSRLRGFVDDYAQGHKANVVLKVMPDKSSSSAWLIIASIAIALLARRS